MSSVCLELITELSVIKIYLNLHKQRLGVTLLSVRFLSLGTLSAAAAARARVSLSASAWTVLVSDIKPSHSHIEHMK